MLRAAVKHGISKALSSHRGFEVWDFDIKQESVEGGVTSLEIHFRYHTKFHIRASIAGRSPDRSRPEYDMAVEVVPGELAHKEAFGLTTLDEFYAAIARWTARLEDELLARSVNRVLAVQQKAINYLEKHLPELEDKRMSPCRVREYRKRLENLEQAVIDLRAGDGEDRAERENEIHGEFESLRNRVEVLGEKSFFHAVLVRLVKYFWDAENLRLVEEGSEAAQQFLGDRRAKSATPAGTEYKDADEDAAVTVVVDDSDALDLDAIRERLRTGKPVIDWKP